MNAAYIEARMKQFKLVDMCEQYRKLIRVASEQSMTYEDFLIMRKRLLFVTQAIIAFCFSDINTVHVDAA